MSTYVIDGKPLEFDDAPEWIIAYMRYRLTVLGNTRNAVMTNFKDLREFFKWASVYKSTGRHPKAPPSLRNADILELPLEVAISIKKEDIETYLYFITDVLENGPATRNKKLAAIRGFYDYLFDQQEALGLQLASNPAARIRRPRLPQKQPIYLSKPEQETFLETIANDVNAENTIRDYALFLLFLCTGIRNSEAVNINMADLSLKTNSILIRGKGNKERTVYISDNCKEALTQYIETYRAAIPDLATDALFVSRRFKTRITSRTVEMRMKQYTLKANMGNRHFTPHKLRHTTATTLAKDGADLAIVQEVLGHENANTTKIYTHLDGSDIARAVSASSLNTLGKSDFSSPCEVNDNVEPG